MQPIRHADALGPLSGRYLGDLTEIKAEIARVAAQANKKPSA